MKPHEGAWDAKDFEVVVCGPELDRGIDAARERLARAAPDMARALLMLMETRHGDGSLHLKEQCTAWSAATCDSAHCIASRAALTKAGVLP